MELNCQLRDAVTLNDNNSIREMYESREHHAMHCNVLQDHGANQISLQEVSVTVSLTDVSGL